MELQARMKAHTEAQQSGDAEAIANSAKRLIAYTLLQMAELRNVEGAYPEAIELCKRSLDFENTPDTHLTMAVAFMQANQTDAGLAETIVLVRNDPKNAAAWNLQGKLLLQKKDYRGAAAALARSLELRPDTEVAYGMAAAFFHLGEKDKAAGVLEEMVKSGGDRASLRIMAGRAYESFGMFAEAEREYKKAIEKDAKFSRGHYFLGLMHMVRNEWNATPEARQEFLAEIAINPDDFFGNYFMGYILSTEKKYDESDKYLRIAAAALPEWPEPPLYMGLNAFGRGDTKTAELLLQKAVELTGSDEARNNYQIRRAYFILGRLLIQSGRKEKGSEYSQKSKAMEAKLLVKEKDNAPALAQDNASVGLNLSLPGAPSDASAPQLVLDPAAKLDASRITKHLSPAERQATENIERQFRNILATALSDLASTEGRRKEYALALAHYHEAERWDPGVPGLMRNIGIAAFFVEDYAESARALKSVIQENPKDMRAVAMRAMALFTIRDYAEAVPEFERLGEGAYSDPRMAFGWATSLARTNNKTKALAVLQKMTANPLPPDVMLMAGQAYVDLGENAQGLKWFKDAAAQDPKLRQAHGLAGRTLLKLKRPAEAVTELQAELKIDPRNPQAQYDLALAQIQTSQPQAAVATLQALVDSYPDYAEAQYELGKALLQIGKPDQAVLHLQSAITYAPDLDDAHKQLIVAYRRAGRTEDANREQAAYNARTKAQAR